MDILPVPTTQLVNFENANLVQIENINLKFILSQAPLNISNWHRQIYKQNIDMIIQLTSFYEPQNNLVKAQRYIPIFDNEPNDFSQNSYFSWYETQLQNGLTFQQLENMNPQYGYKMFCIDNLKITAQLILNNEQFIHIQLNYQCDKPKTVNYFYYKQWSDMSSPSNEEHLYQFINYIQKYLNINNYPIIHCSAGVGRSATFSICWILQKYYKENKQSIFQLMEQFRLQRNPICVQTESQFRFLFNYDSFLKQREYK